MTVNATGCEEMNSNPLEEMKYLLIFLRSGVEARESLSSATQHAMLPEFDGNGGTECLNNRLPLPTLLCAGYSVKVICIYSYKYDCTNYHACLDSTRPGP